MKNNRYSKMIALLLAMMVIFSMGIVSAFAEEEEGTTSDTWSVSLVVEVRELDTFIDSASIVDGKGKTVADLSQADPNQSFTLKLAVSEERRAEGIEGMPENTDAVQLVYKLENMKAVSGSNEVVSWTYDEQNHQLVFKWANGKKRSFSADISVFPNYPAENDLSGNYVLGTARKSMLGTREFRDKEKTRDKLYASEYTETGSKIRPGTDENPVWVLEHVTGNYYTLRAQNTNKYIYISPVANGKYLASSLYLVEGTSETAQKILVTDVGGGYYSFTYKHTDGKSYAINNSGNDKAGNSALRGFGCWTYAGQDNEKFKLYSPSALDNSASVDLSGTWIIANTSGKVSLTSETTQTNRLSGTAYAQENGVIIVKDEAVAFTFEHVIRDWYTVKTDEGYLNITADGAVISSTPQRLMVKTDDNYTTIMLTTGEYVNSNANVCPTYALNFAGSKTFGSTISKFTTSSRMQLVSPSGIANAETTGILYFNTNGGAVTEAPQTITGEAGEKIVLPDMDGTKNGNEFIGWCEVNSVYLKNSGTNHTYHEVYKPGTTYKLKNGTNTLYAIYNDKGTKKVRFGIRKDGVIQDEPNGYDVKNYIGHFEQDLSILKETHWVIDIDSTKQVNDYYVENNVTANLNWMPSAETITQALKDEGNVDFDPETQYIHYYVMKCIEDTTWKIDGVIRNKAKVGISYNTNAPETDKTQITNMPGGYQVTPGTDIMIGTDENSTQIKRPGRKGYFFMGWNTKEDGTGTYYSERSIVHLTDNLNLYAQWISEAKQPLEIRISSDWPEGKVGYVGAKIKLTAELTGFEGKVYTLQWQYSLDNENWVDVPGAHDITYTFTLDATTTQYTWRVVAQDIR